MLDLTTVFFSILLSVFCCFALIVLFSRLALSLGLVDRPKGRKQHDGLVPIIGGLSIYLSVLISTTYFQFPIIAILPFYIGSALVLLGVLDDRFELSARLRLPFQLCIAFAMIYFSGLEILSVGNILGFGLVSMDGIFSVVFTLMCIVGVINSINMIDGIDGLAGSLLVLTLFPLAYLTWLQDGFVLSLLIMNLIAGLLVFLYFNSRAFRSRAVVFMGDAGSMFMGLFLVWCFIQLSQGAESVLSPVSAGWLFGLPLADTVVVMVRRTVKGVSPFAADRAHLHYKFIDAGFTVNQTVIVMLVLHACFVFVGLVGNFYSEFEPALFMSFVVIVIGHFFFSDKLIDVIASRLIKLART